jgi:hypothetical protein
MGCQCRVGLCYGCGRVEGVHRKGLPRGCDSALGEARESTVWRVASVAELGMQDRHCLQDSNPQALKWARGQLKGVVLNRRAECDGAGL